MSGHDSDTSHLPPSYTSELHLAVPALQGSSGGSAANTLETTPKTSSSDDSALRQLTPPLRTLRSPVAAPAAPDSVRQVSRADDELDRRLAEQERADRQNPQRERSREPRARAQHHSIATPATSPRTRPAPLPPQVHDDRVSDLQGQVYELQRKLRLTETQAQEHGKLVELQASASIVAVRQQEEAMRQQFDQWGSGASSEIDSLLNSFHASTVRGEQGEQMVASLVAKL